MPNTSDNDPRSGPRAGSGGGGARRIRGVFAAFLTLGLTSFGGPIAHLAYFRDAFVVRRQWLSETEYADTVALAQFLPGPTSSQVGMAIGLRRAGMWGLTAAWVAFTLPSAILLVAFAYGAPSITSAIGTGWVDGVKAATVAVVAHAVLSMARTLTPDLTRAVLAVAAMAATLLIPHTLTQIAVIGAAALIGLTVLTPRSAPVSTTDAVTGGVSRRVGAVSLALFAALLAGLPALAAATQIGGLTLADTFYRAGSLVFGGGHVVLPLLHSEVVPAGLVTNEVFLSGYSAAQAVPGPLFTVAAFIGASSTAEPTGIVGATIALVAIFIPSALLLVGILPFWQRVSHASTARGAVMGVNAAVVGILAAALYNPVTTHGVTDLITFAIAAVALLALTVLRVPAWAVMLCAALLGAIALN